MAEKRKLLAEMDKTFKKIDEGVEIFEETMSKMQEANSDNQREKLQDDLKKEIKKLQRLRDQVKNWQNSSDIKDKEKLTHYRKVIEQRMEQFKDVERENKTKPHSKQGLSAEEKLDPKEKARFELVEWIQNTIRTLNDEADKFEAGLELLTNGDGGRRRGKGKDDPKKAEKEKELRSMLDGVKFHVDKLEVCMRLVDNETLETKDVENAVKDELEHFIEQLLTDESIYDCEAAYDELCLAQYSATFGKHSNSLDEERSDNGLEGCQVNGGHHSSPTSDGHVSGSRHGSTEVPASPALSKRLPSFSSSHPNTPLKLNHESSPLDSPIISSPPAPPTPPPPPVIPYNSIAAGAARAASTAVPCLPPLSSSVAKASPPVSVSPSPIVPSAPSPVSSPITTKTNDENRAPSPLPILESSTAIAEEDTVEAEKEESGGSEERENGEGREKEEMSAKVIEDVRSLSEAGCMMSDDLRSVLAMSHHEPQSLLPQTAHIPAWLGASPLGRSPHTDDHDKHLQALEVALHRLPQQMDSERPRSYLPKMPCSTPSFYPQQAPVNADTMEYYLRLTPETLFFTFYYMEGSRAQLLAAKALKKLSWRFHTKYLMWFQRHEEPKLITDDFEEGTYVYFDYEKWSQRKKEQFRFEYRYLEDKEFD